jgi:site-specific recombinase XerD
MNIYDLVTRYVAFRQTLGERFKSNEGTLRRFCRAIGPRARVTRIQVKEVTAFLDGTGTNTNSWLRAYQVLNGFFRFAISRGHITKAPLPTAIPKPGPPFVPYIYSRDELRRLLDATPTYRRFPARLEAPTMRAILLLMYGAGLRRQEVLSLSIADVDLPNALLTIRETKFFKSRLVPIGRHLTEVLSGYAQWRIATHPSIGNAGCFFIGQDAAPLNRWNLNDAFWRLRQYAGVCRSDGAHYQPRLHDLRHTFAVNRLTTWYRQGADVQRLVYHLSVYLGHTSLADTQVYLTMTPELLQQASTRFERYACKEGGHA